MMIEASDTATTGRLPRCPMTPRCDAVRRCAIHDSSRGVGSGLMRAVAVPASWAILAPGGAGVMAAATRVMNAHTAVVVSLSRPPPWRKPSEMVSQFDFRGLMATMSTSHWRVSGNTLLPVGRNILPLAFRTISNQTDAALNLFLDVVTRANLSRPSFGREGAIVQLGLDRDEVQDKQVQVFQPILESLVSGAAPEAILDEVRGAMVSLGGRRPNRLSASKEKVRLDELQMLGDRLKQRQFDTRDDCPSGQRA
jgi:hypothetical protein